MILQRETGWIPHTPCQGRTSRRCTDSDATAGRGMLVRAGLARLGCLPGWRCLSSVPRTGEIRTVRQVVDAHAQKGKRCTPVNLRSWWNVLGKLVRQPDERRVLQGTPGILHPLAADTEQALPQFCLLYTSPSPRDQRGSRMPSSA